MGILSKFLERKMYTWQPIRIIVKTEKIKEIYEDYVKTLMPEVLKPLGIIPRVKLGVMGTELFERIPFSEVITIPTFKMISFLATPMIIEALAQDTRVGKIYLDRFVNAFSVVPSVVPPEGIYMDIANKPFTSTFWTKKLMGCDIANEKGWTGKGVNVAVIDTAGIATHKQILGAEAHTVITGVWSDFNGHGHWCATCIAGKPFTDPFYKVPMEGLAPDVHLINIKALGFVVGTGTDSWVISAMEKAIELKADVVNLSLGGETPPNPEDDPEVEVVSELTKRGIVVVCSSGNEGPEPSTICSPAAAPDSLAVAAENEFTGQICDFSSRGPIWGMTKPDTCAPGFKISSGIVGILDALGDRVVNRASSISGTSMSAPHISSIVACMKQLWRGALGKELTTEEVKRLLEVTATAPKDNDRGWGRLSWDRVELYLSTEYGVEI